MTTPFILLEAALLQRARERARAGDIGLRAALARLLREAEVALVSGPFTVTAKAKAPPSGDRRDFFSVGPYWWPDPSKPDGLPYIRRDGEINPERREAPDHAVLSAMARNVRTLALAYFFTGDERYATRAAQLLRVFFLDEGTRMNPHLRYGQAIPGITQGRGIGIIDTERLLEIPDSLALLGASPAWTPQDNRALQSWFSNYTTWLLESDLGRDEARQHNNHGTVYDAQVAVYALFCRRREIAESVARAAGEKRVATQIEPDGAQPHELKRTRSWHYCLMNLRGMMRLADASARVGVDLWRFQTPDGRGIARALDWLIPFARGEKDWDYPQIETFEPSRLVPLLLHAAHALNEPDYREAARVLGDETTADGNFHLLWPVP